MLWVTNLLLFLKVVRLVRPDKIIWLSCLRLMFTSSGLFYISSTLWEDWNVHSKFFLYVASIFSPQISIINWKSFAYLSFLKSGVLAIIEAAYKEILATKSTCTVGYYFWVVGLLTDLVSSFSTIFIMYRRMPHFSPVSALKICTERGLKKFSVFM